MRYAAQRSERSERSGTYVNTVIPLWGNTTVALYCISLHKFLSKTKDPSLSPFNAPLALYPWERTKEQLNASLGGSQRSLRVSLCRLE